MADIIVAGNTSGSITLSAPAVSGSSVLTLPVATDTLVGKATTDTLTNKTLTTPTISSLSSASATALTLQSAGTTAVTIDTSQNVGIGINTVETHLQVYGAGTTSTSWTNADASGAVLYLRDSGGSASNGGQLLFGANQGSFAGIKGVLQNGTGPAGDLIFQTRTTSGNILERARIDYSGNMMTGATSSTFASLTYKFSVTEGLTYTPFGINNNAGGVGASNSIIFARNGTQTGSITVTGTVTAYNTSSDYRLKDNIVPMIGALDKVAQLNPVTYTWITDGSSGQGFIAHELQSVVPECVSGEKDAVDEEGNIKPQGIDTSFLVATLTAAIQELKAIIDTQAERIKALEDNK